MNIEQDNKFIINGKHLLASWGKKEKKNHVGGKKENKKEFRVFPRPSLDLSPFMLS